MMMLFQHHRRRCERSSFSSTSNNNSNNNDTCTATSSGGAVGGMDNNNNSKYYNNNNNYNKTTIEEQYHHEQQQQQQQDQEQKKREQEKAITTTTTRRGILTTSISNTVVVEEDEEEATTGGGGVHNNNIKTTNKKDDDDNDDIDENGDRHHDDDDDACQFPKDVFTMMLFANPCSKPFLYGMMVFLLQMVVISVILVDLTDIRSRSSANPLNVPDDVTSQVRVAQVIAILIAGLSNTDVTRSLELLSVGWRPYLQRRYKTATSCKFFVCNFLRISEGSAVIVASFIFIIQSTTALDIFLNFAAVQFVAQLDDLGYQLAREGWLGLSMRHFNASIENIHVIPENKKKSDWLFFVKPVLVVLILFCLYSTYVVIATRQSNGIVLRKTSCQVVHVTMGGHVYQFSEEDGYAFNATSADDLDDTYAYLKYKNRTTSESNSVEITSSYDHHYRIVGSRRLLGYRFNSSQIPDLHYSYFSGTYYAHINGREDNRPTYYENNYDDITSGYFYYCHHERSWVFTIEAFTTTGAIPKQNMHYCKYGWLMRSPPTDAFTLDQAPMDGWKVWTGVLEPVQGFAVTCVECYTDLDCGTVSRGKCIQNQCKCNPDIAEGHFCNENAACNDLLLFLTNNNNNNNNNHHNDDDDFEGEIYPDQNAPNHNSLHKTFRNIRHQLSDDAHIHERPVYYLKTTSPSLLSSSSTSLSSSSSSQKTSSSSSSSSNTILNQEDIKLGYEVVLYTGMRWYGAYFRAEEMPIDAPNTTGKREFFKRFHAYWNNVMIANARWISEPTTSYMPTGPMIWYSFKQSRSMGSYGPFPAKKEGGLRFECYSVDCSIVHVCGSESICEERNDIIEVDNYQLMGNQCTCNSAYEGHYCEFCKNENCTAEEEEEEEEPIQMTTTRNTTRLVL